MLKDLFRKPKYVTLPSSSGIKNQSGQIPQEPAVSRKELPDGLWVKCPNCGEALFNKDLENNAKVCSTCRHHFRLTSRERLDMIVDPESFDEWDCDVQTVNPLGFPNYPEKLVEAREKSQNQEAVITGRASIEGEPTVLIINDGNFMMGSMGSVVGEKITRAIDRAVQLRLPVVIFSTSGGARMQEGILSLYQMAKTSAALGKLADEGLLYISVLTDPTFGGVTASYASLGDIHIAEPGALIGFTGPRVIKQTMRQELPEGAQTAEFNQEHGLIDLVIDRSELKQVLAKLLRYHGEGVNHGPAV